MSLWHGRQERRRLRGYSQMAIAIAIVLTGMWLALIGFGLALAVFGP